MRNETRQQRYLAKMANAKALPVSIVTCNISQDANVAYAARALACFGGGEIFVIGKIPEQKELLRLSGGHSRFIKFKSFSTPLDFIHWFRAERESNTMLYSAEISDFSTSLHQEVFPQFAEVMFAIGNETDGIPVEIINESVATIHIPMNGWGYCLNTSQTANILLYEFAKQRLSY